MTKYRIKTHELCWCWGEYEVEANSEDEALDLVYGGDGLLCYDPDCTDQIDINSIEIIDD